MSQFKKVELFKGQSLCIGLISGETLLLNSTEDLVENSG